MVIDALAWVFVHNRQVLGVRSRGKDAFYLPGGKREPGESDWQTLAREIREELTVDLDPESLIFLGRWEAPAHSYPAGTVVTLSCYAALYHGQLQPGSEIEEMAWLGWADQSRCAPASQKVMQRLYEQGQID